MVCWVLCGASGWGSVRPALHGRLLGVREMLCCLATLWWAKCTFRYTYHVTTYLPFIIINLLCMVLNFSGRVTGGVYALQCQLQASTLFSPYC